MTTAKNRYSYLHNYGYNKSLFIAMAFKACFNSQGYNVLYCKAKRSIRPSRAVLFFLRLPLSNK